MDSKQLIALTSDLSKPAAAMWPALEAWFCAPLIDGVDPEEDRRFIEVGFQTGTDADNYPVDVPPDLDPTQPWFWLAFARYTYAWRGAVVLWFSPTAELQEVRTLPEWQPGNTLGLDFIARDPDEARETVRSPLVVRVLATFGEFTPVSVERALP